MQRPSRRVRRLGAALGIFAAAVALWFFLAAFPLGGHGRAVIVHVAPGESVSQIAATLESRGVIASALAFRVDTTIFGAPLISYGDYQLNQNSSFSDVRSILSAGPNVVALNVRPGLTLHEVALKLAASKDADYASSFLQAAQIAATTSPFGPRGTLEGLIGVGMYVIGPKETPAALVEQMTSRFIDQAARAGIVPGQRVNGLSAYEAVIAASIVEKEGYYAKNMPQVARVILNRLARHAGLQMDSTILYALGMDGGNVTAAMLRIPSPYNTYLNAGLTPTPICQPSELALRAVAHPPAGSWYYFVLVSRDGTLAFATTFAEQLANERLAASRGL